MNHRSRSWLLVCAPALMLLAGCGLFGSRYSPPRPPVYSPDEEPSASEPHEQRTASAQQAKSVRVKPQPVLPPNPDIEEAKRQLSAAEENATIRTRLGEDLARAHGSLIEAEAVWLREKGKLDAKDKEWKEIVHLTYLTRQRVAIAKAKARSIDAGGTVRAAVPAPAPAPPPPAPTASRVESYAAPARPPGAANPPREENRRSPERNAPLPTLLPPPVSAPPPVAKVSPPVAARVEPKPAPQPPVAAVPTRPVPTAPAELSPLSPRVDSRGLVMTFSEKRFVSGGAALAPDSEALVDALARFLAANPVQVAICEGRADADGGSADAVPRARSVLVALLQHGIDVSRVWLAGGDTYASGMGGSNVRPGGHVEIVIKEGVQKAFAD